MYNKILRLWDSEVTSLNLMGFYGDHVKLLSLYYTFLIKIKSYICMNHLGVYTNLKG